jgi:hypothetical protein
MAAGNSGPGSVAGEFGGELQLYVDVGVVADVVDDLDDLAGGESVATVVFDGDPGSFKRNTRYRIQWDFIWVVPCNVLSDGSVVV